MKTFILGLVAASVAAMPVMAAAPQQHYGNQHRTEVQRTTVTQRHNGTTVVKQRTAYRAPQYRSWHRGERFDNRYARNYRQIDYRQYRGLRAPPRGYRYVQSGNDAVLVGITSGIISAVFANMVR
ncbi:RcnB family protein [Sphingomonas sp. S2-65]|uniref:RcnB family protein n=1 Tax=Sphingomonas sp. S2-65 TaxID=2903960 RepID=UPI001F16B0D7|nr:RcnB family protein [Sphingomonas sp. S2-65]UYY59162.1 RcnB family protein [Sphingomonas sp. S2-65]